jgi:hypothetical protein
MPQYRSIEIMPVRADNSGRRASHTMLLIGDED